MVEGTPSFLSDDVKREIAAVIIQKRARIMSLRIVKRKAEHVTSKLHNCIAKRLCVFQTFGVVSLVTIPLSLDAGEHLSSMPSMLEYISNVIDVQKMGKTKVLYGICHGVRTACASDETFPMLTHKLSLPKTTFSVTTTDAKGNSVVVHVYPVTHLTKRHETLLQAKISPKTFASTIPESSCAFEFTVDKTFIGAVYLQKFGSEKEAILAVDSLVTTASKKGYGTLILNTLKRMVSANHKNVDACYIVAQCVNAGGFWDYRMHPTNIARSLVLQQAILDPSLKIYDGCTPRCLLV